MLIFPILIFSPSFSSDLVLYNKLLTPSSNDFFPSGLPEFTLCHIYTKIACVIEMLILTPSSLLRSAFQFSDFWWCLEGSIAFIVNSPELRNSTL